MKNLNIKHKTLNEDILSSVQDHQLELEMPAMVTRAAKKYAHCEYDNLIATGRVDLRKLPFVTIDGKDAKDFDDAVYCTADERGGYVLSVAISDVANFVKPAMIVDQEAIRRGNSTYFPTRVLPMLPANLSEQLCSLLPEHERLVLVCKVWITTDGKIAKYSFSECVIKSAARLTYEQAEKILLNPPATAIGKSLGLLGQLTQSLVGANKERGALSFNFSSMEAIIKGDDIAGFRWSKQLFAHKAIEESMLIANFCAARFLSNQKFPFLYRVHGKPEQSKVMRLRQILQGLGIKFHNADQTSSLQEVVEKCEKFSPLLRRVVMMNILRTLQRATYTTRNCGHYALKSDKYTHFTSPIRRYPDLLTHRAIKAVLHKQVPDDKNEDFEAIGVHCSERELSSERASLKVLGRQYTRQQAYRAGQQSVGIISGMSRGGIFVMLDDGLEGMIRFSSLHDDYYELNETQIKVTGRKNKTCFFIGQEVAVRIVGIDDSGRCRMALN